MKYDTPKKMPVIFHKIHSLIKTNPIPTLALAAILLGIGFYFSPLNPLWAHGVWLVTLILGGLPIVYNTLKGMLQGHFASDIVAMLAIITALFLNQAFAGAIVVLMQSGGEAIERYGFRKATFSLEELLKRSPSKARRKRGEQIEEIDATEVEIGDTLLIRPGELIPVDSTILVGVSQVDESAITGEPLSKEKGKGEALLSGSVNVTGVLEVQATKKSEESQYAKIVRLVEKAQAEKAPIQRLADRYAIFFTPLSLCMALIGYLVTSEFLTVLAVLVVATPCPLILATPLAVICGINRAAKQGIIVKGGAPIEKVADTEIVFFDKTGTITLGKPTVDQIIPFAEESAETLLFHAASLEQFSTHPIATAIVQKAKKNFPTLPEPLHFKEVPGEGVSGELEGHLYAARSSHPDERREELKSALEPGAIPIYFFKDDRCIGVILLKDQMREEAPRVMQALHNLGIEQIHMITGDSQQAAEHIARQAQISSVEASLLPEQKVEILKKAQRQGKVLSMVGDGINDAPALASATVGIAMGARGTAISAEAADIVLLDDDLFKVVETIHIGKRMLTIAKQSIFIGIGLSFSLMVIACTGLLLPPVGALLQEIIDVSVILNALRVLKK